MNIKYCFFCIITALTYLLVSPARVNAQNYIQGDLNKDGKVDIFDYNILVTNYSNTACGNVADINLDCKVDIFDYNILVTNYGRITSTPTNTPTPTPRPVYSPTSTPTPIQTTSKIYWGAYIRGASGNPTYPADYRDCPWDTRTCDRFETNAGKKVSIIHFGQSWKTSSGTFSGFPYDVMNTIRNRGTIPMLGWGSWQLGKGVNQPAFKLTNITRGDYDAYITQYAKDAAAWGHPFFLRFDHEMNIGGQFSWNYSDTWTDPATGATYKNTATDFINMWRHVVTIFRNNGATNVTWVWCPNIYYRSGSKALPFMQAYPGDSYVDWNCVDGYNKSTNMTPFANLFTDSYNVMQQKVTGTDTACSSIVTACNPARKPIMIGEWASTEAGDGGTKKANWEKDALLTQLPKYFPAIKAVVWFNWNSHPDQIIESTPTALAGFRTGITSSYFAANNYANISVSPITPP